MQKITIIVLFLLLISIFVYAELPNYRGYVNDFANILSSSEETQLTAIINEIEKNTSVEIAIVTIDTTESEGGINQYAERLFAKWKIGKKGEDNGLLILVSVKERLVRIEVGYGLEGYIPDLETKRIREEFINPKFKEGDYGQGLINSIKEIKDILQKKEYAPGKSPTQQTNLLGCIIFILIVILIIYGFITGKIKPGFGGFSGGRSGGSRFRGFGGGRSGGGGSSGKW